MKIWDDFVNSQEAIYGKKTVDQWLRTLELVTFDARNLYFKADSFQRSWFKEHIESKLKHLIGSNGKPIKVHFESKDEKKGIPKKKTPTFSAIGPDPLLPTHKLTSFYENESNQLAFKLIQDLHKEPTFNPIFIYGPKASGKTHLLMSAAHHLKSQHLNVFYVSAKHFTQHVIGAIQQGNMEPFRKTYRHIDCLIVDDIEVFGRKNACQEEFFHTFNYLHTASKQIILSATCPPSELQHIEQRLISRFEWGLSLQLEAYSKEEIQEILKKKATFMQFTITDEVVQFLCDTFSLSQIFVALDALILRQEKAHDLHQVKKSLHDLIEVAKKPTITPNMILETVSSKFGLMQADLTGKGQTKELMQPRKIAMYLMREFLKIPYLKIGEIFGRDHSTVMSAIRAIDPEKEDVKELVKKLKSGV